MNKCFIIFLLILQIRATHSRAVDTVIVRTLSATPAPLQITITHISKPYSENLFTCEGIVRDSATSENLVAVNVFLLGTRRGIATNLDGKFRVDSLSASDTLLFQVIGNIQKKLIIRNLLDSTKTNW